MPAYSARLAEYVSGPQALTAHVSDTSLSADTVATGIHGYRAAADTSASSDSPHVTRSATRAVSETSLSTDMVTSVGPRAIVEHSRTADMASAGQIASRTIVDISASSDAAGGYQSAFASDISLSTEGGGGGTGAVYPSGGLYPSPSLYPSGGTGGSSGPTAQLSGSRTIQDISLSGDQAAPGQRHITATVTDTSTSSASTSVIRTGRASDVSQSVDALVVHIQQRGFSLRVREKAPLQLSVNITTPAGGTARWAGDDPNPRNVPGSLTFSTTMPGGDEQLSTVLARDPAFDYPDLEPFSLATVHGAGKQIAAQHRLESAPDQSGDQMAVTPGGVGWQSHLDDDNSAREVFVDRDITAWQGPSIQRQIGWLQGAFPVTAGAPTVGPDFTTQFPSLVEELSGSWTQSQLIEAWYDAHGIPLGKLYAAWETNGNFALTGTPAFGAAMFLASDDTGVSYDQINPLLGSAGAASLLATTSRPWALLQLFNNTAPGGKDGVNFDLFWTAIGVYGRHGLPLYGTADSQNAQGVLASDAIAYAINKWCPKLAYSTGPSGTIQPSSFVIPHLVFLDPSKTSDIIKEATKYELLDWAVEPGPTGLPTFFLNPRGARGQTWRARSGPAKLQGAGPQVSRIWNGVVVQWADVTGVNRTVGPPGSGCNYTDAGLVDTDPLNPANQDGLRKYALVTMSTSTLAGATQVGRLFLQEQKTLDMAGQASLTGHVQDANGIYWPAWMVRAGDSISFTDAADTSPRRIVHTSYDDTTKTNAVQLDQPPDSLAALLQRLSVVLTPYGMS